VESQCSGSTVAKPPSLRVLVVEDDKLARGALRLILELDGYDVRATGNGLRALRVLKDFNPQMVIMDWRVSGLCGERLCGAIRRACDNLVAKPECNFCRPIRAFAIRHDDFCVGRASMQMPEKSADERRFV